MLNKLLNKKRSIKQLLLIAFLLAGFLPALMVSILSFYQARDALKTEISHDLNTLSIAVANDVERVLFERFQNVRSWSQLAIMQELQIGDVDKRLSEFLHETRQSYGQEYLGLHVTDLQGRIIATSQPQQLNQTLQRGMPWFSVSLEEMPITLSKDKQRVWMSAPIYNINTAEMMGTIVAEFNTQVLTDLLNASAQNAVALALVDHEKQSLATSSDWNDQGHVLHAQAHLKSQHPTIAQWQVYVEKAHTVAVAPIHRLAMIFVLLLAIIVVFALILVTPIAHSITQPLVALTQYVQDFYKNKPQLQPLPQQGPQEVQALSQAFSEMQSALAHTQDQLTRTAKLAVVGEMAAAMSHEVRTPLGIMRSSADVLAREPHLSQDGREVLGFIVSETERLNKLVSGLIDAARPRPPNKVVMDLVAHLQHVIALLRQQAEEKQIVITLDVSDSLKIFADQDQITQVLMNLLVNAIQILPAHGNIAIHLHKAEDGFCLLSIADDGPGIPADMQARIFESFFTQRAGGVGLGLAVVKQILNTHQAEITYTESQWHGAQFNIRMPLHLD